jgi:hypothetical protein
MRRSVDYRVDEPPAFTRAQAASIREFLSESASGD